MNPPRFFHIDVLRAIAIINIIIIHTFSFNLTSSLNNLIWNYLHFIDVVAFVFCSGYVVVKRISEHSTLGHWVTWFKKRLGRLLLPFYGYLLVHYSLLLLFPAFFTGLGLKLNLMYFIKTITLVGGLDITWIPLLFLELSFVFPFLLWARKNKWLHYSYLALIALVLIQFTIHPFPYNYYRTIMWLPWSFVLYVSIWFYHWKTEQGISAKRYLVFAAFSFTIFTILFIAWHFLGKSLTLTQHKYPPDLYYFSYAFTGTFLVLLISQSKLFLQQHISRFILLVSQESYALFFIHFILLDLLKQLKNQLPFFTNVWLQVIIALVGSISIVYALQLLRKKVLV